MKLLHNNVLIEKIPTVISEIIHTPNGFTLEVEQKGRVVDVGPGRLTRKGKRIPCDVKPGDTVFYYEPAELHATPQQNQFVVSEDKIFFVLNEAQA